MNILLIEILACLIGTAILSLFIGWVIRGVIAKKEVHAVDTSWETKLSELQLRHKQDTELLENQVDRLDSESNQLAHKNDSISETLRENELSVHQARSDAIELNRKQADTQERLQRIIAQKDEELRLYRENSSKLGNSNSNNNIQEAEVSNAVGMTSVNTDTDATEAKIASLSAKRMAWEAERQRLLKSIGDEQETIAIDPADLPTEEPLDKTVRINQEQSAKLKKRASKAREPVEVDTDTTQIIEDDQTLVLDDHNINGNGPQRPINKNSKPRNNDD